MSLMDEQTTLRAGKGASPDGETRDLILKAAQHLFLERGYKGVSMRDIAEEVRVSQAALYYHFPQGKEQVLYAMMDEMMTRYGARLLDIIAHEDTLRGKLEGIARNFLSLPFDRMMVLMRDIHTNLPDTAEREKLHHRMDVMQQTSAALFQEAIDVGEIRSDLSAEYLAQIFGGMLGGIVRYAFIKKPVAATLEKQAGDLVSVLLDGIATKPE